MNVSTKEMARRHDLAVQLLVNNETALAALAWQGFQKQGKGYLVVALSLNSGANIECETVSYFGNANKIIKDKSDRADHDNHRNELETILETYNPRREFVAMIVWNDQFAIDDSQASPTEHWFCHASRMTPIQAFTAVKHRPLEFGIESFKMS